MRSSVAASSCSLDEARPTLLASPVLFWAVPMAETVHCPSCQVRRLRRVARVSRADSLLRLVHLWHGSLSCPPIRGDPSPRPASRGGSWSDPVAGMVRGNGSSIGLLLSHRLCFRPALGRRHAPPRFPG